MGQWGNVAMSVRIASLPRWLIASFSLLVASCNSPTPPGPLGLSLATGAGGASIVRVSGLSTSELGKLQAARLTSDAWHALLRVTVAGSDTPMAGRYVADTGSLEFHPQFPLDPGRGYVARLDPARLPTPRDAPVVETMLSLPAPVLSPSTVVSNISPTSGTWPENLLRFYVYFSAPMSRQSALGVVHLVDDAGKEVEEALLPLDIDLWNAEHTRYTVFFDPGRVKKGVRPNLEMGRALVEGRRYAIVVDAAWRDAQGQPLKSLYRHEFRAGPAVEQPLAPREWRIGAPVAGTRDALVVTFPWALDQGLLQRAIGVARARGAAVTGQIRVDTAETRWSFVPAEPWTRGAHELVVLTLLEDPSGNKVGRAFEADAFQPVSPDAAAERISIPFEVK
jgi:hypothetical protein